MPSPTKPDHTRVLVQVADDVHAAADARRRREGVTWSRVVTELLQRWASGADDAALTKPVRVGRPATPEGVELEQLVAEWMQDPAYRRAATERVDINKLTRYGSLGELLAAGAARAGRAVPPGAVAAVDAEVDDGEVDA